MDAKDKILDAAVRVFADVGTRGATTRRIAEEAGVNEVTLFRHFGSKERLLREALCHASACRSTPGLPEDPGDPRVELTRWADQHLRRLSESRSLVRTSMGEFEEHAHVRTVACEVQRRVANDLNDYLVRLQQAGRISADCDTRVASALLMGAIFSDAMSRDMVPERYPYPMENAAAEYVRLFLRAIEVRAPGPGAGGGSGSSAPTLLPTAIEANQLKS